MERGGNYIYVSDGSSLSGELFNIPQSYRQYIGGVYISRGLLGDRIRKLAIDVRQHFGDRCITILVVLRGAFRFAKDLVEGLDRLQSASQLPKPYVLEFIRIKSYVNDSSGNDISISGFDINELRGKNVLVVEDLIDTGKTMQLLMGRLHEVGAADLRLAVTLYKRNPEGVPIHCDFIGFSVPNDFIVGYHMDYNDYFTDLAHLCSLNDEGKSTFRIQAP
jgi:hypoxanthine phosphoribosyltransferase